MGGALQNLNTLTKLTSIAQFILIVRASVDIIHSMNKCLARLQPAYMVLYIIELSALEVEKHNYAQSKVTIRCRPMACDVFRKGQWKTTHN